MIISQSMHLYRSMTIHHNAPRSGRMISNRIQRLMFSSGSTTYYDSQSGQHVSIHDETKIIAYSRKDDGTVTGAPSSAIWEAAKEMGMNGSIITLPQQLQHDFIKSLGSSSNSNNFLHILTSQYYDLVAKEKQLLIPPNINLCFEYNNNDSEYISSNVQSAMANFDGIQTSIGIFNPTYLLDDDPMLVAAQIASIIDTTSEFGGTISNILVAPITDNDDALSKSGTCDDELVQLCEELSYLDVPGSTIKSRLVVSALSSDQLDECLQMGITKYIIDTSDDSESLESRLDMLRDAVEENGKELILE